MVAPREMVERARPGAPSGVARNEIRSVCSRCRAIRRSRSTASEAGSGMRCSVAKKPKKGCSRFLTLLKSLCEVATMLVNGWVCKKARHCF